MENPLTSLDELIWEQFEKVTQYAQKNYGWDKWDLALGTDRLASAGCLGAGVYYASSAITTNRPDLFVLGLFTSTIAPAYFYLSKKKLDTLKNEEIKREAAVSSFPFSPVRPLGFGITILLPKFGLEIARVMEDATLETVGVLLGMYWGGFTVSRYFSSQLPTPPSTKKSFWKTTYEGIRNKIKPRPQLEPAAEPTQQYATIDTVAR